LSGTVSPPVDARTWTDLAVQQTGAGRQERRDQDSPETPRREFSLRSCCNFRLRVEAGLTQLGACTAQRRTNAVFRHADRRADLAVRLPLEMVHADNVRLSSPQLVQQPLNLLTIADTFLRIACRRTAGDPLGDVAQALRHLRLS